MKLFIFAVFLTFSLSSIAKIDFEKLASHCPEGTELRAFGAATYHCQSSSGSLNPTFQISLTYPRLLIGISEIFPDATEEPFERNTRITYNENFQLLKIEDSDGIQCFYDRDSSELSRHEGSDEGLRQCRSIKTMIERVHSQENHRQSTPCEGEFSFDRQTINFPDGRVYKLDKSQSLSPRRMKKKIKDSGPNQSSSPEALPR